jgi:hypothetical protein
VKIQFQIVPFKCNMHRYVVAYGRQILAAAPIKGTEAYAKRYKGIWIALTVLMRALSGNYVNFGVFELYGDMVRTYPKSRLRCWRKCPKCRQSTQNYIFDGGIIWPVPAPWR